MNDTSRFGEPVELPWWAFALAVPPLAVVILAAVLSAPWWGRALGVASSVAMIAIIVRVAARTESRNMQSVWISLLGAVWFFCAVTWAVSVAAGN